MLAKRVKGVKGVSNQIAVNPSNIPDEGLVEFVKETLRLEAATNAQKLTVTAGYGKVTVKGVVESEADKMIATNAVLATAGVREFINEVTVKLSEFRDDAEMTA